jgi:hypothetical protein
MITRLMAVPVSAALLFGVGAPATSAKMTRQDVGDAFILAMKVKDTQAAAEFVNARGPGGNKAVLERPDYVYKGQSSWDIVTGADCHGLICLAKKFPATPEPGWYVLKRNGAYRVVARAYLDTADYLLDTGTFGCLTKSRKVRNKATNWNLVKKVSRGTPVWWVPDSGYLNVAVDAGSSPRKKMIFGYIPHVRDYVSADCSD